MLRGGTEASAWKEGVVLEAGRQLPTLGSAAERQQPRVARVGGELIEDTTRRRASRGAPPGLNNHPAWLVP